MVTMRFIAAVSILLTGAMSVSFRQQPRVWDEAAQLEFLKKHWGSPIAPQGKPPAGFSALESSLVPASCGACHQAQFEDWKTTIHSRSAGPGLFGQTPAMLRRQPESAAMCYTCHAPLAEQQEISLTGQRPRKNPRFDAALQQSGLGCAACHVRNHQRFGPPRPDGSLTGTIPAEEAPHGGATLTPAFERAEFCAGCHQFEDGDRELNGKLLENTYNEWKEGPYAQQGIACQQCHMPDRRHLWRGIHDPEMVKSGVTVELQTDRPRYRPGEKLEAILTLTNSGVGHNFPTYVTPRIELRIELLDAKGLPIPGSQQMESVGREATLDLSREIADTRIPPRGKRLVRYARSLDAVGITLRAVVIVHPDDFYRRFYEAKLTSRLPAAERRLLTRALENSRQSSYTLFEQRVPVS